jgi:hypothetical protein
MLFTEALLKLKEGEAMRRLAWAQSEGYLKILPDMGHVWKIITKPTPNAGNFIFSIADFDGEDWVKFEVPEEVIELDKEEE